MIDDVKGNKAGTLTENRMRAEHLTLANGEISSHLLVTDSALWEP